MKENSYTELMKSTALNRKRAKEAYVLNLYIDMLLSEVLLKSEKEKLSKEIDRTLEEHDKESFQKLSAKYKELVKKFGT